jgi:plasmid stabilization system protein ParE
MAFKIVLTKRANDDLSEIIDFYNEQPVGVTQSFLREFISAMDLLAKHPKASPIAFSRARKLVLAKFPFNIFYNIRERPQVVVVARIWHQKRNPTTLKMK